MYKINSKIFVRGFGMRLISAPNQCYSAANKGVSAIAGVVKAADPIIGPINLAFYFMSFAGFICRDMAYKYLDEIDAPDSVFDDYFYYFRVSAVTLGSLIFATEMAGNFFPHYYGYRMYRSKAL